MDPTTKDIEGKPLPLLLQGNALRYGERRVALREKEYGIWQAVSWQRYYDHVKRFALGLKALGLGKNDKLARVYHGSKRKLHIGSCLTRNVSTHF